MSDFAKKNKQWWDKATPIHASSKLYDLKNFKKGKSSLFTIEDQELTDIKGKSMLHVLCHFGMDSLSFARKGAQVTGLDISQTSIDLAQQLSKQQHILADFVCSDIADAPDVLDKKFDIVYASYGVLCWLEDLEKFAHIVSKLLKKGGYFYIAELHPFTNMLSAECEISLPYFSKDVFVDDSQGTYTDWNAPISGETYVWLHSLSDLMNAFITAGFSVEYLHEFPYTMYEQFPGLMKKNKKGQYVFIDKEKDIPLLFSLKMVKK